MPHIKEIKESTVKRALRLHQLWLDSERRKGRQLIVTDEIVNKLNFEKIKDFSGANFSQANFSYADFSEKDMRGMNFKGAIFKQANFSNAIFFEVVFDGSNFENCDFSEANFESTNFEDTSFSNCIFNKSKFIKTMFIKTFFYCLIAKKVQFKECDFDKARFTYADFSFSDFSETDFSKSTYTDTCFDYVDCSWMEMVDAVFTGVSFNQCSFNFYRSSFSLNLIKSVDFRGVDLSKTNFLSTKLIDIQVYSSVFLIKYMSVKLILRNQVLRILF